MASSKKNKSEKKELKELKKLYKEASVPLEKSSDKGNALTKGIKKLYRKLRHSKLNQKLSNRTNDDLRANKIRKQSANNIVDKLKLDIELGSTSVIDAFIDKARDLKGKMNSRGDVKQDAFNLNVTNQAKAIKTNLEQMKSVLYNSVLKKFQDEKPKKPFKEYMKDFLENPKNDKFMQKYKALENNITLINSLLDDVSPVRTRSNAVSHQDKPKANKETSFELADSEALDLSSSPFEDLSNKKSNSSTRNRSNAFSKQEKPKETAFEIKDPEPLSFGDSPSETKPKTWTKGVTNKTQELIQKFEQKNAKTSEKISEPNLDDEISKMFKFSKSKDLEQATEALKPKNMEKAAKNTKPKIGIRGNKSFGITD